LQSNGFTLRLPVKIMHLWQPISDCSNTCCMAMQLCRHKVPSIKLSKYHVHVQSWSLVTNFSARLKLLRYEVSNCLLSKQEGVVFTLNSGLQGMDVFRGRAWPNG
jgi:hypothetical protein